MKRAFAIAVALCTLGVAGFAQLGAITGSWSFTARILPAIEPRSSVLTLTTKIAGFDITSTTTFGDIDDVATGVQFGFREQAFSVKGALGPFTITGSMAFNAGQTRLRCWECVGATPWAPGTWVSTDYTLTAPAYKSASLTSSFEFGGITLSAKIDHWAYPYACPWPCPGQTEPYMLYTFSTTIAPVTATLRLEDCCTGIEFKDVVLTLKGVELCCGIKYDFDLSFTKAGFDYAQFALKDLSGFLCCGATLDIYVRFGVDYKSVNTLLKIPGVTGCFTVYTDAVRSGTLVFDGIKIYGYKITCTLADCSFLEVLTVLEPPPAVPGSCDQPAWYTGAGFRTNEWQYLRVRLCAPGCCGGSMTVTGTIYFATGIYGGLFDMSRLMVSASIPVSTNLTLSLTVGLPMDPDVVVATGVPAGQTLFDLGFSFKF